MAARKTLVVKIGSSTLVGADGRPDEAFLDGLAAQAARLREAGWSTVVVSSGAIACGLHELGFAARPADIPSLQAAASVGQNLFASAYAASFSRQGLTTSLVLLTRHDTARRSAYLHARDTFDKLLEFGVVPVVNENDTVSVEEIRFGDNDTLAAVVSCLVGADLCVLFSDVDGLYDGDPADAASMRLDVVERIDERIWRAAGGAGSAVGTGGMATKVKAARALMTAGIPMVVCDGREDRALERLAAGEAVGTLFRARELAHEISNRKLWIALGDAPAGALRVDAGAARALVEGGKSLLCVGVTDVEGAFEAGDVVDVKDERGAVIARGKVGAGSDEVALARGRSQRQLAANRLLAPMAASPVIHRDDLVVFE